MRRFRPLRGCCDHGGFGLRGERHLERRANFLRGLHFPDRLRRARLLRLIRCRRALVHRPVVLAEDVKTAVSLFRNLRAFLAREPRAFSCFHLVNPPAPMFARVPALSNSIVAGMSLTPCRLSASSPPPYAPRSVPEAIDRPDSSW
jgi:hypothetical protein